MTVKIWYVAREIGSTGIYVYDREEEAEIQPPNSSQWPPAKIVGEGLAYLTPANGWHTMPDFTKHQIKELREMAVKQAELEFASTVYELHAGYPEAERQSWAEQYADAQALLAGLCSEPPPLIAQVARAMNVSDREWASRVVDNHWKYKTAYAAALAKYKSAVSEIAKARSADQLPGSVLTYDNLVRYYS